MSQVAIPLPVSAVDNDRSIPLCVDLDGTLAPTDTLHESLVSLCRHSPLSLLLAPAWLRKGKAHFKDEVAARTQIDAASLPYRADLLEWLRAQRASGRRLVLATASNRRVAESVAAYLGLFDEIVASNSNDNLSGESKRSALVERFGEKGFDYVGNARVDELVWRSARKAIVVGGPQIVARARRSAEIGRVFPVVTANARAWLKAIRLHQWVKNGLIFVPAILGHRVFEAEVLMKSVLAFVAFGLCASSVYIVNDLFDLAADRRHPRKRERPFATGILPVSSGVVATAILLIGSAVLAVFVSWQFCAVLAGYYALTWGYSVRLKRAALVDVMTLAGLYSIRIIAGSAATGIPLSFWLLAFSIFMFLSLGFVKRYTELYDAQQTGKSGGHGRGYWPTDLPLLLNLGTAAGYCTVVVMALYINSPDSQQLYRHHKPLWLICPLLLYWVSRMWLLTTRGQMHDDPVVFATKDRISLAVLGLLATIVLISV